MTAFAALLPRSPAEVHRAATPLELFVDLCFVVAIAQAAASLHHAIAENHVSQALIGFPMVFFAIWWAWLQFTWFASGYDNDDAVYRIATFVQVAGILVLAAGVPTAFEGDFRVIVVGYVIVRLSLVFQYLRAAASDPARSFALRGMALAIGVLQVLWVLFALFVGGDWQLPCFVALIGCEMAVPVWGQMNASIPWHPHHIAERYSLLTIIVLGESILASVIAVQSAADVTESLGPLVLTAAGALVIVCSMWWLYFNAPTVGLLERSQGGEGGLAAAFAWGFGHYVIFIAAAAVGAGVAVLADVQIDVAEVSLQTATLAVGVPVSVYVVSMWALHRATFASPRLTAATVAAVAAVLAASVLALPILVIGSILVVLIAVNAAIRRAGEHAPVRSG
jgi:low temperature requirement protein LtrA